MKPWFCHRFCHIYRLVPQEATSPSVPGWPWPNKEKSPSGKTLKWASAKRLFRSAGTLPHLDTGWLCSDRNISTSSRLSCSVGHSISIYLSICLSVYLSIYLYSIYDRKFRNGWSGWQLNTIMDISCVYIYISPHCTPRAYCMYI